MALIGSAHRPKVSWRCSEADQRDPFRGSPAELSATLILDDVTLLALSVDMLLFSRPSAVLSLTKEQASASACALLQITPSVVARLNFCLADVIEVEVARAV